LTTPTTHQPKQHKNLPLQSQPLSQQDQSQKSCSGTLHQAGYSKISDRGAKSAKKIKRRKIPVSQYVGNLLKEAGIY